MRSLKSKSNPFGTFSPIDGLHCNIEDKLLFIQDSKLNQKEFKKVINERIKRESTESTSNTIDGTDYC